MRILTVHVCELPTTFEAMLVVQNKGQLNLGTVEKKGYRLKREAFRAAARLAGTACFLLDCKWEFYPLRKTREKK